MSNWKVGDRVQREKDSQINVGVITAVDSQTVERSKYDYYTRRETKVSEVEIKSIDVMWDGGTEEKGLARWDVHVEDSAMEREYRLAVDAAHDRIYAKLQEAGKLISEAEKISEETGIPFSSGISPLGQSYIPGSLKEKFPDVDTDFAYEVADAHGEYDGWQHSAVCY